MRMTIPKLVSESLNWKEGDILEAGVTDSSMIVKKA
jgi:AbrB family looped-hinge helix DNA binding protein